MRKDLKEVFLKSVDECLREILGDFPTDFLYFILRRNFSLSFSDLYEKTEVFDESLRRIFGNVGAIFLEREILRRLCDKLGLVYRDMECSFADYVKLIEETDQPTP